MSACAADDCRKPLPAGRLKWCSDACKERLRSRRRRGAQRGVNWDAHPEKHPNTSDMWEMRREMDAAGGRGRCIFCERGLSQGRRLHCGSERCTADYHHMYDMAKRTARAEQRLAA